MKEVVWSEFIKKNWLGDAEPLASEEKFQWGPIWRSDKLWILSPSLAPHCSVTAVGTCVGCYLEWYL